MATPFLSFPSTWLFGRFSDSLDSLWVDPLVADVRIDPFTTAEDPRPFGAGADEIKDLFELWFERCRENVINAPKTVSRFQRKWTSISKPTQRPATVMPCSLDNIARRRSKAKIRCEDAILSIAVEEHEEDCGREKERDDEDDGITERCRLLLLSRIHGLDDI